VSTTSGESARAIQSPNRKPIACAIVRGTA
jgi:hypothetical protein